MRILARRDKSDFKLLLHLVVVSLPEGPGRALPPRKETASDKSVLTVFFERILILSIKRFPLYDVWFEK